MTSNCPKLMTPYDSGKILTINPFTFFKITDLPHFSINQCTSTSCSELFQKQALSIPGGRCLGDESWKLWGRYFLIQHQYLKVAKTSEIIKVLQSPQCHFFTMTSRSIRAKQTWTPINLLNQSFQTHFDSKLSRPITTL